MCVRFIICENERETCCETEKEHGAMMEALNGVYFDSIVPSFVRLCEATGLYWGPNERDLFFYRPPWLHPLEFVVFHLFVSVLMLLSRGYFTSVTSRIPKQNQRSSGGTVERMLGGILFLCWLSQVYLKAVRPMPLVQIWWLIMPCHLITLLWCYVFLVCQNPKLSMYLASLATAFHWGPVSAAMFPDWSDHQYKIEGYIFVVHHGLLVILPLYYAARHGLLRFNMTFLIHATWVATWINVGPYTAVSYLTGLNVNYHLYPPPKLMKLPIFASPFYRFYVIAALVGLTVAFYCGTLLLAWIVRKLTGIRGDNALIKAVKKES